MLDPNRATTDRVALAAVMRDIWEGLPYPPTWEKLAGELLVRRVLPDPGDQAMPDTRVEKIVGMVGVTPMPDTRVEKVRLRWFTGDWCDEDPDAAVFAAERLLGDVEAAGLVVADLDDPALQKRLRVAICDPGAILPRGDNYEEPVTSWQVRAVLTALRGDTNA